MNDSLNQTDDFRRYMSTVVLNEESLKEFVQKVSDPSSLKAYALDRGYNISLIDAQNAFDQARTLIISNNSHSMLSDDALDHVNGGISLTGIGAIIGGAGAAGALTLAVGFALTPVTGGASLAAAVGALAGMSTGAALSVVGGAMAAGAVGAGVGALGGHAVENS